MSPHTDPLDSIVRFARRYYDELDFAHGVTHGERVVRLARRIAAAEGGDPFLVEAGAWLHQLHDDLPRLRAFLDSLSLPEGAGDRLLEIVGRCRPHRVDPSASLEARIVFDADALEVLGPYGTVRELLCNALARGLDWPTAVAETRRVQEDFAGRLATRTGRRLAARGRALVERFWNEYDAWERLEIGGE